MVNGVGKNSANLTLPRIRIKPKVACQGVGKNWAGPFFPHPDKIKQQPYSEGYRVGEYCRAYGKSSAEKHSQPYPVMNAHVTAAF